MKKLIITAALACLLAPVFAVSWGGLLDNSTGINANHDFSTISLAQSNGLHLYANAPLNNTGTMKLVAEGSAKYTLNNNFKSNDATFKFILDCDLLKFSGKWITSGGSVSLDLGRFTMADFSGVVFAQKSDGLYLSYNSQKLKAGLYGGYTGLQNRLQNESLESDRSVGQDQVCHVICDLVSSENPAKPLSDQQIFTIMHAQGLIESRRSVAYYRKKIGIPASFARKKKTTKIQKKGS